MPRIAVTLIALLGCGAKTGLTVPPCDSGCCTSRPEECNGRDDDCDGAIDDGVACFFLNGDRIEPIVSARCGADWYSYDSPDAQSANPSPDIRVSNEVVALVQTGASCAGASVAVIADLPRDGSGGRLSARFVVDPAAAAHLLVSDEPNECTFDAVSGAGSCSFTWQPCCTDGLLLGPIATDACVTLTLGDQEGVNALRVRDGERAIDQAFGPPMEICAQIRPAVP